MKYFIAGLLGAACGYWAFTIAAHLEGFSFFTIRSWVTGKTVMSEIIHHPADGWIIPTILGFFLATGAGLGMLACSFLSKRPKI